MKKPRKDRRGSTSQAAPVAAVLLLLIANGQALVLTLGPVCG